MFVLLGHLSPIHSLAHNRVFSSFLLLLRVIGVTEAHVPDSTPTRMAMEVEVKQTNLGFPYWRPIRRRFKPDSPFFQSGNIERELLVKQVAFDLTEEEKEHIRNIEYQENSKFFCPIVGCGACLKSLDAFEDHYTARHTASCSVCSRVYPTARLLSIHVSEVHDSFFQAKVARGFAMYECLVEACGAKLKSYKSRQQHLVDKHKFPATFEFYKKAHLSKKQRQKIQQKQVLNSKEEASRAMQIEDDTMNDLVSAVSRLSTSNSPSTVSFGRRHTRGLAFVPRAVQRDRKPDSSDEMRT